MGQSGAVAPDFFDQLRRAPDVEAPDLVAVDATDRLLLDEAADLLVTCRPGEVAVVDDNYGALTLGAAALHRATDVRVHQDLLVGELALARNAERTGLAGCYRQLPLGAELVDGARVVLVQAPKGLEALREIAEVVAAVGGAGRDAARRRPGQAHDPRDERRPRCLLHRRLGHARAAEVPRAGGPRPAPRDVVLPAPPGARRPRADRVRARRGLRRDEDRHRHPRAAGLAGPHGAVGRDGPGPGLRHRRARRGAGPQPARARRARRRPVRGGGRLRDGHGGGQRRWPTGSG